VEESMGALDQIVRQGKALYVGISSYSPDETLKAYDILNQLGTPLLIHQPKYSMLVRNIEEGLLDVLGKKGIGCITFSSLAQGILTNKYLNGIPSDSRAASKRGNGALEVSGLSPELLDKVKKLDALAERRSQTLAQMALAWVLKDPRITSVIIGASKPEQVLDSIQCLKNNSFAPAELEQINRILSESSQTVKQPA
jgi:L-glyceraldehyde 3-phosphate reductase